jgi:uncharacterized RDD family membrane protein YckC
VDLLHQRADRHLRHHRRLDADARTEETTTHAPIDYIGIALLVLGVGLLQVVLDKGNDLDWFASSQIVVMSTISAISLVSFVIWELGERHPIVNLRLFKDRNFAIGTLSLTLGYAAFLLSILFCRSGCKRRWATPRSGPDWPPRRWGSCR